MFRAVATAAFVCLSLSLVNAQTSTHGPIVWTVHPQDINTYSGDTSNPSCNPDPAGYCAQDSTGTLSQMTIKKPMSIKSIDFNAEYQAHQQDFDASGNSSWAPCDTPPHVTVTDGTHTASLTLSTGTPGQPGYIQPHDTTGPISVTMSANTTVQVVFDWGNPATDGYYTGNYPANTGCFVQPGTITIQYAVQ